VKEGDKVACPDCGVETVYTIDPARSGGAQFIDCPGCGVHLVGIRGKPVRPPLRWRGLKMSARIHILAMRTDKPPRHPE
jgi:hypothetical protein